MILNALYIAGMIGFIIRISRAEEALAREFEEKQKMAEEASSSKRAA